MTCRSQMIRKTRHSPLRAARKPRWTNRRNQAARRRTRRGCGRSFHSRETGSKPGGANTFEWLRRYTSLGTEVVFPLTSALIISKLALFPHPKGKCAARSDWFGSGHALHSPKIDEINARISFNVQL